MDSLISYITIFFITAALIFIGFFGEIFYKKAGVSEYIFLILIGIFLGPVLKIFPYSLIVQILPYVAQLTLAMIMLEIGLNIKLEDFLKEGKSAILRTIFYVSISIIIIFYVFKFVFGWSDYSSFFLATIIGGETTTAVVPYLAKKLEDDRFFINVSLEASLNSVVLIVLFTFGLNSYLASVPFSIVGFNSIITSIISQISIGVFIGFIGAIIWIEFAKRFWLEEFFYIATIGYTLALYAFISLANGSPILGVLTFGFVLLNNKDFAKIFRMQMNEQILDLQVNYVKTFQKEITFFLRTYFFFLLGLVITIDKLFSLLTYEYLAVAVLALLASRFIAVKVSTAVKSYEKAYFVMMAQGLTPAVLSSLALYYALPEAHYIVTLTSLIIIVTNAITVAGWAKASSSLAKNKETIK